MFNVQDSFYKNFPTLVERLPNYITKLLITSLKKIFHEQTYNDIYNKNNHLSGLQFVDSMIDHLKITYTVKPYELQNIPATGKLLVIANHITGASDAFSLVQLLADSREDKKVRLLVNGMLMGVTQASSIIIPVDNISGAITKTSLRAVNDALENNEAVVIFPAGVVNRLSLKGLKDTAWKSSFLKIAKRTATSILPVRIESRNSILFYLASMILPKKLTGLLLPREFAISGKMKPLHFNIGKVIPVESFSDKNINNKEYIEMFYKHLYSLGTNKPKTLQTEVTIGQPRNKKIAFKRLAESQRFKIWVQRRVHEITVGETLDQKVERLMSPENLIVEEGVRV